MQIRKRSRRALVLVTVPAFLLFPSRIVSAQDGPVERPASWLKWSANAECPNSQSIEERLSVWLNGPLSHEKALKVEASATPLAGSWLVSISLTYGETTGRRDVELATCDEAADFVAFTVALAVDPDLDLSATTSVVGGAQAAFPEETSPAQKTSEPEPESPKQIDTPPPSVAIEFEVASPPEKENTAPGSEQEQKSVIDGAPNGKDPDGAPAPHLAQPRAYGAVGARGMTGILPEFALGPSLGLGASFEAIQISGELLFLNGSTYSFEGWPNDARMRAGALEGKGCYLFGLGAMFKAGPCASLQLGLVAAQERTPDGEIGARGGTAIWVSFLAGLEAKLPLHSRLELAAGAHLSMPFIRPTFKLEGGTPIFQSSLGFSSDIAFRIFF
jgi:hypothetical protein